MEALSNSLEKVDEEGKLGNMESGGSSWMAKRSKNKATKTSNGGLGLSIIPTDDTQV
jgi:hypothetical protein